MASTEEVRELIRKGLCPVCRNTLVHMEGCIECEFCGWSACEEA